MNEEVYMPSVVKIQAKINDDAIKLLNETIERIKSGKIEAVTIVYYGKNNVGSVCSDFKSNIFMFAALQEAAYRFHADYMIAQDEE